MSNASAAPPECAEASRSRAQERRLRRRRQEARLRLRLVADSVLLSKHHASRTPAVSAAPAFPPPAHDWKREAEELRALLHDMRLQLNALLAAQTTTSIPAAVQRQDLHLRLLRPQRRDLRLRLLWFQRRDLLLHLPFRCLRLPCRGISRLP